MQTIPAEPDEEANTSPQNGRPDVAAIMRQIRSELRKAAERGDVTVKAAAEPREIDTKDLHTANAVMDFPVRPLRFQSHRSGIGPLIDAVKKTCAGIIRDRLLAQTSQLHYEFNGAIVRYLNRLNGRINAILRRSEDDLRGETYAIERRLEQQFESRIQGVEARLAAGEAGLARSAENLSTIESVVRGLERLAARGSGASQNPPSSPAAGSPPSNPEYLLLENRFRGSAEQITERLRQYPGYFSGLARPVLEIGAGRGELQRLFKAAGVPSYGIDLDAEMAAEAASSGLDVRAEDALQHLESLSPATLGGAVAIQVIEHLNQPYLKRLLALLRSRVCAGGTVIFETVNTGSIVALTQNYLRDPTHVSPIHPDSMRFIMELSGFEVVELKKLSPFPAEAALLPLPPDCAYTPGAKQIAGNYNENVRRLNDLLFGWQDYALIMRVPND